MLVLVAATAARSAQAVMEETGRRSTAGGFDCDGIGARDVHTNTRASQADRRFFQGQRSAEHVLAMDKRATDRLPEMKHDAEAVRACDVSPFANAPGVAPISGAPSFHATSDTEVFVCPAARLAFIHIFKCAGTTLIASVHDLCRATLRRRGLLRPGVKFAVVLSRRPHTHDGGRVGKHPELHLVHVCARACEQVRIGYLRAGQTKCLNDPCVLGAGATSEGDQLALNVLDSCVLSTERREEVNPHLRPSINFLLEPDGSVTPLLAYVGRVVTFVDDWPAASARDQILRRHEGCAGERADPQRPAARA